MNETKRNILEAGRDLFNRYGVASVSQRRIAEQLGISPGNLTYHFKKSNDIVEALYFELVGTMDQAMAELKSMKYDQQFLFKMVDLMVESFFKYRFIFLDFVQIMRHHEPIRKHYEQLSLLRKQQFEEAIEQLINTKMIRKEELPHEYDYLYQRFQLLSDFWISDMVAREEDIAKQHLKQRKELIIQSLYPYLTPKGQKIFLEIYQEGSYR